MTIITPVVSAAAARLRPAKPRRRIDAEECQRPSLDQRLGPRLTQCHLHTEQQSDQPEDRECQLVEPGCERVGGERHDEDRNGGEGKDDTEHLATA